MLSERDSELIAKNNLDRFYSQVSSLRRRSNIEMTQVTPTILIYCQDDEGNVVNLNQLIFSVSPHDRSSYEEPEFFPERPIASIESFEVTVQEPSVGGVVGISMGTLSLKVHNPKMITRSHPIGKYIAYMMSQGFVMRIRYGVEGFFDSTVQDIIESFQWIEQDFFVSHYDINVNNDETVNLKLSVMPATQRLMNQFNIGQSIPVEQLGSLKQSDIENIVQQVVSSDREISEEQVSELRRRLSRFSFQLNSATESPGVGMLSREDGTFGFQLHAALTNEEIFSREESIHSIPASNMVEAFQSIQGILLTRRFENILQKNCYRSLDRETQFNAINLGPLVHEVAKPEIDYIFATVARNQIEIGEKFSSDGRIVAPDQRSEPPTPRTNVKLVFGNFNSRAGQWANKCISTFPINVESVFSYFRQRRNVGEFAGKINQFFRELRRLVQEDENYSAQTAQGSESIRLRLEKPSVRYVIYPDSTDESSWIMYVYDDKVPTVRLREIIESLASESPPTNNQIKRALEENSIPWIEMGEEGSFIKQFTAGAVADDLLASNAIIMANRQSRTVRDLDSSTTWPAGVSREFLGSIHMTPQQQIRNVAYTPPIRVSVQSFVLPTAYYMAPIFVFFPIRTFTGVYIVNEIRHDIKAQSALTNMNLIINLSVFNQIPL